MPQLDATTYPGVFTYLFLTFIAVYVVVTTFINPYVVCVLKLRSKLTSQCDLGKLRCDSKANKRAEHDMILKAALMRLKLRLLKGYTVQRVKKYDASKLSAYYVGMLMYKRKIAL